MNEPDVLLAPLQMHLQRPVTMMLKMLGGKQRGTECR
jgi:hypothetical protein